jgi:hypothetical protein
MDTRGHYWLAVGRLAFDCGGRTYRFGEGLHTSDLPRLEELIRQRLSVE